MSLDKLVDSTQLDADLTSVANAIRTKGGTSAQLAFPADFVSAIDAISGGSGGTSGSVDSDYVTIEWEIVTVGSNTISDVPDVIPYLFGLASFSQTGARWKWACVVNKGTWYQNMYICTDITSNFSGGGSYYRYRSGAIQKQNVASGYDAKVRSGDKYLVACLIWKGAPTV